MRKKFDKKVNERVVIALNNIISREGVALLTLSNDIGFAYSTLSSIKAMRRGVPEALILLLEKYKRINSNWLLRGIGQMHLAEDHELITKLQAELDICKKELEDKKHVNMLLERTVKDKEEIIASKDAQITKLKEERAARKQ